LPFLFTPFISLLYAIAFANAIQTYLSFLKLQSPLTWVTSPKIVAGGLNIHLTKSFALAIISRRSLSSCPTYILGSAETPYALIPRDSEIYKARYR
jgi:hypothetical protein